MIRFLKDISNFSRKERRSLVIILILIILSLFYRIWLGLREPPDFELSEKDKNEIQAFIDSFKKLPEISKKNVTASDSYSSSSREYYNFDPNKATRESLIKLGISTFAADNILRYRGAGGVFSRKEDLKKIYGLDEETYHSLEQYIIIKNKKISKEVLKSPSWTDVPEESSAEKVKTGLNSAEFSDLVKIKGMDPKVAGRILNYRELLGGYTGFEQLSEVYGMPDSVKIKVREKFKIDSTNIRKISLRKASFSEMLRHPYLDKKQVSEIIRLREFYSDSIRFEHIMENRILPESTQMRIKPYFGN